MYWTVIILKPGSILLATYKYSPKFCLRARKLNRLNPVVNLQTPGASNNKVGTTSKIKTCRTYTNHLNLSSGQEILIIGTHLSQKLKLWQQKMSSLSLAKTKVVRTYLLICICSLKANLRQKNSVTLSWLISQTLAFWLQHWLSWKPGDNWVGSISESCSQPNPKFHAVRVKAQSSPSWLVRTIHLLPISSVKMADLTNRFWVDIFDWTYNFKYPLWHWTSCAGTSISGQTTTSWSPTTGWSPTTRTGNIWATSTQRRALSQLEHLVAGLNIFGQTLFW